MTAVDPFADPSEVATRHADHAATWQELATEQMENVDNRQYGQRREELVLRFADLNLQRAKTSALLAIAHELRALRVEMATKRPPRRWQRKFRRTLRQAGAR